MLLCLDYQTIKTTLLQGSQWAGQLIILYVYNHTIQAIVTEIISDVCMAFEDKMNCFIISCFLVSTDIFSLSL